MSPADDEVPPICPFCGDPRLVGRVGSTWVCYACREVWIAFNEDDKTFLRVQKIRPT